MERCENADLKYFVASGTELLSIFRLSATENIFFFYFQVNDVLVQLGYKALPCPVARDTKRDHEIQQKIMELKKERLEQDQQQEEQQEEQQQEVVPPSASVSGCFVSLPNIEAVTLKKAQQSTNHVSFGPEYVRHIPPRSKKY